MTAGGVEAVPVEGRLVAVHGLEVFRAPGFRAVFTGYAGSLFFRHGLVPPFRVRIREKALRWQEGLFAAGVFPSCFEPSTRDASGGGAENGSC